MPSWSCLACRVFCLLTLLPGLAPASEHFFSYSTNVHVDKLTGWVNAEAETRFFYYYYEVASASATVSLMGGNAGPPVTEMDNCGGACALATTYGYVSSLGTSYYATGSHDGWTLSYEMGQWNEHGSSYDYLMIPDAPVVSFLGIENSNPRFPAFRFGFSGEQPAHAGLQVGNGTPTIGFPGQNSVSLSVDLESVAVGNNGVVFWTGMYGLISGPTQVCSVSRKGPVSRNTSAVTEVLVGGEGFAPEFVPFQHTIAEVIDSFDFCQTPSSGRTIKALSSLGTVQTAANSLDIAWLVETHTSQPDGYSDTLEPTTGGIPANGPQLRSYALTHNGRWISSPSTGITCNQSTWIVTPIGGISAILGCLSVSLP